jgi:hypothetical protein
VTLADCSVGSMLQFYAYVCRFVIDIAVLLLATLVWRKLESRKHAQHV